MDKLDLLVAAAVAEVRKGGLFTPRTCLQQLRDAAAVVNNILQEDQESRDELNALSLDLKLNDLNINIAASAITIDIKVVSSSIMMPVDLQGSYIMMPVDIQGQYIDLDVNIVAQDVTISVAIASSVTITVTASQLSIQIDAQNVGVYIARDWAAKQDNDLYLVGSGTIWTTGESTLLDYTVPSGYVVYVDAMTFTSSLYYAGSWIALRDSSTTVWTIYYYGSGITVFEKEFSTPHKFIAGHHVKFMAHSGGSNESGVVVLECRLVAV